MRWTCSRKVVIRCSISSLVLRRRDEISWSHELQDTTCCYLWVTKFRLITLNQQRNGRFYCVLYSYMKNIENLEITNLRSGIKRTKISNSCFRWVEIINLYIKDEERRLRTLPGMQFGPLQSSICYVSANIVRSHIWKVGKCNVLLMCRMSYVRTRHLLARTEIFT